MVSVGDKGYVLDDAGHWYALGKSQGPATRLAMLTTLSLFHLTAGLLSRDQANTIFDRGSIPGRAQLRRYGLALLAIVAVTLLDPLNNIFGTIELNVSMWTTCALLALSLVVVEEIVKYAIRRDTLVG